MNDLNPSRKLVARPHAGCFPVLFLMAGLLLARAAHAYTTTVCMAADGGSGSGSLLDAISGATDGGTLIIQATVVMQLTNELEIGRGGVNNFRSEAGSLPIKGLSNLFTNIDLQNYTCRVFNINSRTAAVTISGLTISDGFAQGNPAQGGGIFNACNLTLRNYTYSGNSRLSKQGYHRPEINIL
jgi:hypothetical protein